MTDHVYPGSAPWTSPGDYLYARRSIHRQDLIQTKADHDHDCACVHEGELDGWGERIEWTGGIDAMHWSPTCPPVVCEICDEDHGAECPHGKEWRIMTRIDFAGSEQIHWIDYDAFGIAPW